MTTFFWAKTQWPYSLILFLYLKLSYFSLWRCWRWRCWNDPFKINFFGFSEELWNGKLRPRCIFAAALNINSERVWSILKSKVSNVPNLNLHRSWDKIVLFGFWYKFNCFKWWQFYAPVIERSGKLQVVQFLEMFQKPSRKVEKKKPEWFWILFWKTKSFLNKTGFVSFFLILT